MKDKIEYKEKRRQIAESSKNYKCCEEITEEIETLEREGFAMESELLDLQKRDKKSRLYRRKRLVSISSSETTSVKGSISPVEISDDPSNSDDDNQFI